MPVLFTITTISYLFVRGSRGETASFLDPAALRKKLDELPEQSTHAQALAIADQLDGLAREYDQATEAAVSAYAADLEKWTSSAGSLLEILEQQDQVRRRVLRDLVQLRQSLFETLSPADWQQVFANS